MTCTFEISVARDIISFKKQQSLLCLFEQQRILAKVMNCNRAFFSLFPASPQFLGDSFLPYTLLLPICSSQTLSEIDWPVLIITSNCVIVRPQAARAFLSSPLYPSPQYPFHTNAGTEDQERADKEDPVKEEALSTRKDHVGTDHKPTIMGHGLYNGVDGGLDDGIKRYADERKVGSFMKKRDVFLLWNCNEQMEKQLQ